MSGRKFADGDRVIVSDTVVDGSDKRYSGRPGTVESYNHRNGDLEVYSVLLDSEDYPHAFYDSDLLPYGELDALKAELAQAEAQVVQLKAAIRLKERNAAELPVATVISYEDNYGPALLIKQNEAIWLLVSTGSLDSEVWDDQHVTRLLTNNPDAVVRRP